MLQLRIHLKRLVDQDKIKITITAVSPHRVRFILDSSEGKGQERDLEIPVFLLWLEGYDATHFSFLFGTEIEESPLDLSGIQVL